MGNYKLIATSAMGIEALVANEVRELGYECEVENGKVIFQGDKMAIARTNLWLRTADRIRIVVGKFTATTFDELFEQTKALNWEDYLPVDAEFPVQGKSVKSKLFSVSDCQAIVKKSIAEKLKMAYKRNDWLDESGPLFKIEVSILKDVATLTIDATGPGLHKRGYRIGQGEAPLKETLAAALLKLTNWQPGRPLHDPFCGSGTLPIEAALIGQNIAPGFNREFLSEKWPWLNSQIWEEARQEVEDLARYDEPLDITGTDIDHRMIDISKSNAFEAGLGDLISFKQMQAKDISIKSEYGVMIGNPPYGERIGDKAEVEKLYSDLGYACKNLDTWSVYVLTSHPGFEKLFGKQATRKRKLFNGFIRTDFYQYWGPRPPRKD